MDLIDIIQLRKSIRKYGKNIPPIDDIRSILELANNAPSAGNLKPRYVEIINDKNDICEISRICKQPWMSNAPYHILVFVNLTKASTYGKRGIDLYCIQDSAAMIQNILLLCVAYGLGTCWVGAFDEQELASYLNLQEDIRPVAVITIGYEVK